MQLPVVTAAERHRELIADFDPQCSWLGKAQVMWVGRMTAADNAGLGGYEPQMGFVPAPSGLRQ
jgi:hypothetical protein